MEPGRLTTVFLSSCRQVACGSFGEEFFKTLEDRIRIAVGNRSASPCKRKGSPVKLAEGTENKQGGSFARSLRGKKPVPSLPRACILLKGWMSTVPLPWA